jgi:rubrerythrin
MVDKAERPDIPNNRVSDLADRLEAVEKKIEQLESVLDTTPPVTCPMCGARALRLSGQGMRPGGPKNEPRYDEWTCQNCGHTEARPAQPPAPI